MHETLVFHAHDLWMYNLCHGKLATHCMKPNFFPLHASRSGLWVSFGGLLAMQALPRRWVGVGMGVTHMGISLWPTSYPCTSAQKPSLACLPACLPVSPLCSIRQAGGGVFVCSHWFPHSPCCQDTERCRRADGNTGTLQDNCLAWTLNAITLHSMLCICIHTRKTQSDGKNPHRYSHGKQLQTVAWTDDHRRKQPCENMHSSVQTRALILTGSDICYCFCCSSYNSFSDTQAHSLTQNTITHTVHFAPRQRLCSPAYKWRDWGTRSFFSNLLFLSSLLFFFFLLASLTLGGSMDVLLESIPAAQAINKRSV